MVAGWLITQSNDDGWDKSGSRMIPRDLDRRRGRPLDCWDCYVRRVAAVKTETGTR